MANGILENEMAKYRTSQWDLTDLVQNSKSPEFEAQIEEVHRLAKSFERSKSKLSPKMSSDVFMKIIADKQRLYEKLSVIEGFASLSYAADTQSDEATSLLTRINKLGSDILNQILFFDLWWKKKIDENNAQRLIRGSGELQGYLGHKRLLAKYSLSEPEERIINTLDVTGASALVKLYDKITNAFEYTVRVDGKTKTMTREQIANLTKSTNSKTRERAYRSLLTKFADNRGVLGEIYQNIVLNWRDEGIQIRGHSSPLSIRNIGNDVDDKTVTSLLKTCKNNSSVFQRFFTQKAKMIGIKKLRRYDLYAPAAARVKEKNYTYDEAVRLVLESLARFSPMLSDLAKNVFTQNHVDSPVRTGKRDGAFCSTPSPKITPFVLVNYTGRTRDVFTLAHELGHAVHSLAASKRSILVQHAPLPLAETASTFSELLLYDNMSQKATDNQKKSMLSEKIDDLYATIMRQSFFTLFEIDAHKEIAQTTTIEELSRTYLANLRTQFGSSVTVSDDFSTEWSCIPHFYHTPFYCYAYSFGNLLALSLFQRYKKEGDDFVPAYTEILAAGGSVKPEPLLKEYGFDIRSSGFWQDGFDYVNSQVSELAKLS